MKDKHCYLFALEIEPLEVGEIYDNLPMHLTLVHRFWTSLTPEQLEEKILPIVARYPSVSFVPREVVELGPKKTRVFDLEQTEILNALHMELYSLLNTLDTEYTEQDWVGKGYVPHISEREHSVLTKKKPHTSKAVYIIEVKIPGHDHKHLIRKKLALS
jgi:hypothetical protein